MLDHINTLKELEEEAILIDRFLSITISEDPEEAIQRGNDLIVYMARTGKMLADAKFHQDKALASSIKSRSFGNSAKIPPSILNKLVSADCEVENYMVNWTERLHRVCVHQVDWLRTVISKAKEEIRMSGGMNQR
jgi:hypothetical protein